ncbi:hypothetical protein [Flavobacterium sp. UMI-01]|uniref:hypothetical protein n=1 Tax=Flavobacterium sp. UMI-01 TaxID=1441053 RepID=UPI001C7CEC9F|nr:hypothetical protein [Flavobacterium sp. UMI-01]GIZ08805.1 hypothetical protein FUMI01_15320 [Flavobacterium sp. UMI-01]
MKTIIKNIMINVFLLTIGIQANDAIAQSITVVLPPPIIPKNAINGKIWTFKGVSNPASFAYNDGVASYYIEDTKVTEEKFQFSETPDALYDPKLNYWDSKGNYIIFEDNKDVCKIEFIDENEFRLIFLRAPGEPVSLPGHVWTHYVVAPN